MPLHNITHVYVLVLFYVNSFQLIC